MSIEKDWITNAGLRAVVVMTERGHRCGYVGLTDGHPLFGVGYSQPCASLRPLGKDEPVGQRGAISLLCMALSDEIPQTPEAVFDVHGSLTFADRGWDGGSLDPAMWWLGFDCAHCDDAPSPDYIKQMRTKYPGQSYMWSDHGGVHRTLDYCVEQCESLARQIIERTTAEAA
jgi:hypothetical protein